MLAPALLRREGWPKRQACVGTAPISAAPASTRSPAELVGFTVAARALGRRARGGGEKERRWWTALDEEIFGVWPPAVANLLLPALVGSVDLFWIGRSGDAIKIAGMGATNQVFNTIYFLISFLPTIVTPRVAEEWAQQRRDGAAQWVTDAMSFAALLGLVGTVVLVGFPHSTLRLVADSPDVLQQAVPYCWIRGCSLTATLCSSVSFAAFRALLDFKTPLKVALATNAVNALLDPLLMHWMGVSGVALATTLAEISGAVSLAVLLRRKKLLRGFRMPAVDALKTFLQNGPAVQVRSASTNLMFLLAVRRITRIDPTGVQAAAYQVSQQFWNLAGYVSLALSTSAAGLVPNKYFREGGVEDARRLADRLYLWGACLGVLLCVLQLLCLPLVSMYTPIKAVQRAARAPAILAALLQLMNGVVFAGEGILLGLKAYGWLACGSGFGCALMVTCLYLFGDDALTGFWVGIYFFNFTRLVASLSHRLRFGPLARRSTG